MTPVAVVLVVLAGLSEAAGRILPLVARRSRVSRPVVCGLLLTGTAVESAVIALWPLTAWALARLGRSVPVVSDATALTWTPAQVAPLLLCAVIAFPLLGPLLHLSLLLGVGAGLAGPLAAATGVTWWTAAGCLALAGVGLAAVVEAVRRVVARTGTAGPRELPA
ncbi:hypothetical protein [Streptomyces pilosus]|uniref:Integral membrane protein n=1 Tax=Streptomyces pilosus TaxID=28893 RepID=A0A918EZQ0_9ACTN|nr:hypothetical protein [Streptomyces pilosus]GGQ94450.1 hypothetical protein GCM10010280_47440 [Streptomyces pilosus]GGV47402.1 hypothetical protein GCM10010261_23380 [Streptomyces pilosus]